MITFNTNHPFDHETSGPCAPGSFDDVSVLLHEVTHWLGFSAGLSEDGSYFN